MEEYVKVEDDLSLPGRWYLNRLADQSGLELDSREFQYGRPVDLGPPLKLPSWKTGAVVTARAPLKVLLDPKRRGRPLDLTFTNADMPVATHHVAEILKSIEPGAIQLVPVEVESTSQPFDILNVTRLVNCIDFGKSEVQFYTEGNSVRPDKAGQPEMITKLVINPESVDRRHVFRVAGWEVAISNCQEITWTFCSLFGSMV